MKDTRCRESSIVLYLWSKWGDQDIKEKCSLIPGTYVGSLISSTYVPMYLCRFLNVTEIKEPT